MIRRIDVPIISSAVNPKMRSAALFQDTYALPLTGDDARVLTRRTGGWPAALHLFRHVVAGRPAEVRRRAVQALGSRDEFAPELAAKCGEFGLGDLRSPDTDSVFRG